MEATHALRAQARTSKNATELNIGTNSTAENAVVAPTSTPSVTAEVAGKMLVLGLPPDVDPHLLARALLMFFVGISFPVASKLLGEYRCASNGVMKLHDKRRRRRKMRGRASRLNSASRRGRAGKRRRL